MAKKKMQATCDTCQDIHEFTATEAQIARYNAGEHIQDAFPHVSPGIREIMISGMCGDCFDNLFAGMEE